MRWSIHCGHAAPRASPLPGGLGSPPRLQQGLSRPARIPAGRSGFPGPTQRARPHAHAVLVRAPASGRWIPPFPEPGHGRTPTAPLTPRRAPRMLPWFRFRVPCHRRRHDVGNEPRAPGARFICKARRGPPRTLYARGDFACRHLRPAASFGKGTAPVQLLITATCSMTSAHGDFPSVKLVQTSTLFVFVIFQWCKISTREPGLA